MTQQKGRVQKAIKTIGWNYNVRVIALLTEYFCRISAPATHCRPCSKIRTANSSCVTNYTCVATFGRTAIEFLPYRHYQLLEEVWRSDIFWPHK